jgi:hypothetical protein
MNEFEDTLDRLLKITEDSPVDIAQTVEYGSILSASATTLNQGKILKLDGSKVTEAYQRWRLDDPCSITDTIALHGFVGEMGEALRWASQKTQGRGSLSHFVCSDFPCKHQWLALQAVEEQAVPKRGRPPKDHE